MSCSELLSVPQSSTEYIRAQISYWAGTTADPTNFKVDFAFTPAEDIPPTTWYVGDWDVARNRVFARVLVGPGSDAVLLPGVYAVWIRVNAVPESPVRMVGTLRIS